jgi:hypothetical protein
MTDSAESLFKVAKEHGICPLQSQFLSMSLQEWINRVGAMNTLATQNPKDGVSIDGFSPDPRESGNYSGPNPWSAYIRSKGQTLILHMLELPNHVETWMQSVNCEEPIS